MDNINYAVPFQIFIEIKTSATQAKLDLNNVFGHNWTMWMCEEKSSKSSCVVKYVWKKLLPLSEFQCARQMMLILKVDL